VLFTGNAGGQMYNLCMDYGGSSTFAAGQPIASFHPISVQNTTLPLNLYMPDTEYYEGGTKFAINQAGAVSLYGYKYETLNWGLGQLLTATNVTSLQMLGGYGNYGQASNAIIALSQCAHVRLGGLGRNANAGVYSQLPGLFWLSGLGSTLTDQLGISLYSADATVTATGTLGAMNSIYGTVSASNSFSVSGIFLTGNLTVNPPAGYEVSLNSGSGYTTSLSIAANGTLAATNVYVRLVATTPAGTYSGNVTIVGGGAASVDVATTASTVSKSVSTATLTVVNSPVTYNGQARSATVSLTASNTAGSVQNTMTGGVPTQTVSGTYPVTADFVPANTNYTTLTGLPAGNFTILGVPTISSSALLLGGSFQLNFNGTAAQSFKVIGTNQLMTPVSNWPVLKTGIFGVGGPLTTNYTDSNLTNGQRFYRIVSP